MSDVGVRAWVTWEYANHTLPIAVGTVGTVGTVGAEGEEAEDTCFLASPNFPERWALPSGARPGLVMVETLGPESTASSLAYAAAGSTSGYLRTAATKNKSTDDDK
jgi:hypothetical protein